MPGYFIKRLALFFVLLGIVNFLCVLIAKKISAPYANEIYATKYSYYQRNQSRFNTLFFGSSRTHRQVNPGVIDKDLKELKIKSFNMGSPGTFNPEALFLYEDFLKRKNPDSTTIKYAFVELTELTPIADKNAFSPRSYYYLNFDYLLFVLKYYASDRELNFQSKAETVFNFIRGYFLNHFLPFYPREVKEKRYYLGKKKDGFFPVDTSLKKSLAKDLLEAHADFLKDTSVLIRSVTITKETQNSAYLVFLNNLILKSESCHIKLYFVIPPSLKNYAILTYLKNHVNHQRVIDLGDCEKYPELYLAKYSFDGSHLNNSGANIYSNYLSKEMRNKISSNAN